MRTEFYLDTARLGRMCARARRAEQHYAKLVSQLGSSLYFDRFLRDGFGELPYSLRRHVPHLKSWHGVSGLKQRIRDLTGLPSLPILLASRSKVWMELAAKCLFTKCQHVLATDLEWPPYLAILKRTAITMGGRLTVCRIGGVDSKLPTEQLLMDSVKQAYHENSCDGLFLSAVSYHGVRVPLNEIIRRCSGINRPAFVAVDGAQALGHTPLELSNVEFDLLLTGSHKWLQGNLPLGIAICCRMQSASFVTSLATHTDPLFRYCEELARNQYSRFGETAIVTPLFTTNAALIQALVQTKRENSGWVHQLQNRTRMLESIPKAWELSSPNGMLTSGAIILQSRSRAIRTVSPSLVRAAFVAGGMTLTAYRDGAIRMSIPSRLLKSHHVDRLTDVLATIA